MSKAATWVVVVKDGLARVFEEPLFAGALRELPALRVSERSIGRLAAGIMEGAGRGAFDRLVVLASAATLKRLRGGLTAPVAYRIELADAHVTDCEGPQAIRMRLRKLRAQTRVDA